MYILFSIKCIPRIEYISQIMKDMDIESYRDLKKLSFDRSLESYDQPIKRLKKKVLHI